jgi:hypothetical protein
MINLLSSYIQQGLFNYAVDEIKKNLPENVYTDVSATSCKYNFFGCEEKDTVMITLSPSGGLVDKIYYFAADYFVALPKMNKPFNCNLLTDHILGIAKTQESELQLTKACNERLKICIYIAKDTRDVVCKIQG